MYGEEKGNLNVMKGVSVRTGGVELTKGYRSWLELGGAGSWRDGMVMRIERKESHGGKNSREEGRKKRRIRIRKRK